MGALPLWQRPPTWLYLPSQGLLGHGYTEQLDVHADADASAASGVQRAEIRGRPPTPGRGGHEAGAARSAVVDCTRSETNTGGRSKTSAGGSAAGDDRASGRGGATEARSADTYIMDAYLEHHRERVKRRQEIDQIEGRHPTASAAERMAALRRRVTARGTTAASRPTTTADMVRAARSGCVDGERRGLNQVETTSPRMAGGRCDFLEGSGGARRPDPEGEVGGCARGKPEAGDERVRGNAPRRNELLKIHHSAQEEDAWRIRDPACEVGSGDAMGTRGGSTWAAAVRVAATHDGRAGSSSDADNAASSVAWHTIAGTASQPP